MARKCEVYVDSLHKKRTQYTKSVEFKFRIMDEKGRGKIVSPKEVIIYCITVSSTWLYVGARIMLYMSDK